MDEEAADSVASVVGSWRAAFDVEVDTEAGVLIAAQQPRGGVASECAASSQLQRQFLVRVRLAQSEQDATSTAWSATEQREQHSDRLTVGVLAPSAGVSAARITFRQLCSRELGLVRSGPVRCSSTHFISTLSAPIPAMTATSRRAAETPVTPLPLSLACEVCGTKLTIRRMTESIGGGRSK